MSEVTAYLLRFRTPVSVFTGLGISGLVDRTVTRNQDGLPCISGSTVKGRWRFFAERLLRGNSLPSDLWLHADNQPWCKDRHTACTLCRLFGNPSLPALLQVGQGELLEADRQLFGALLRHSPNPVVHPDAELRPGIALSRRRRVAVPDHLFFDEVIPAVQFRGPLRLIEADLNPNRRQLEITFLKAAGCLVESLGARKAGGRGALEGGIQVMGV
jgi:CRISPR/Cas system CSM-associated protein Csm3 (group 7 of RAMP superfamily)